VIVKGSYTSSGPTSAKHFDRRLLHHPYLRLKNMTPHKEVKLTETGIVVMAPAATGNSSLHRTYHKDYLLIVLLGTLILLARGVPVFERCTKDTQAKEFKSILTWPPARVRHIR